MKNKLTVNTITKIAILAALAVVFRRYFTITIPVNKKIGIGYMPIMIAGILYGPMLGALTGGLSDVVGMLLNPDGVFHPGFTLSAMLIGIGAGLISHMVFKKDLKNKISWISILSSAFTFMVVRLLIDSIWLTQLFNNPYIFYVVGNIPKNIVETILNAVILIILVPRIEKYA